MESCALPGTFFSMTTDGDITAAMQALAVSEQTFYRWRKEFRGLELS